MRMFASRWAALNRKLPVRCSFGGIALSVDRDLNSSMNQCVWVLEGQQVVSIYRVQRTTLARHFGDLNEEL